jgi:outer membrane protein
MKPSILIEVVFKVFVIVFLVTLTFLQIDSQRKIAYVDTVQLMAKYKGMDALRAQLEARSREIRSNMDTLQNELNIIQDKISSANGSNSDKIILQEELRGKAMQMQNYQANATEVYKTQEGELSKKLYDEVNEYVKQYGKEKKFGLVLMSSPYGNIAYADEAKDITDEVLAALNSNYKQSR